MYRSLRPLAYLFSYNKHHCAQKYVIYRDIEDLQFYVGSEPPLL